MTTLFKAFLKLVLNFKATFMSDARELSVLIHTYTYDHRTAPTANSKLLVTLNLSLSTTFCKTKTKTNLCMPLL
jgi:hypothetical protein